VDGTCEDQGGPADEINMRKIDTIAARIQTDLGEENSAPIIQALQESQTAESIAELICTGYGLPCTTTSPTIAPSAMSTSSAEPTSFPSASPSASPSSNAILAEVKLILGAYKNQTDSQLEALAKANQTTSAKLVDALKKVDALTQTIEAQDSELTKLKNTTATQADEIGRLRNTTNYQGLLLYNHTLLFNQSQYDLQTNCGFLAETLKAGTVKCTTAMVINFVVLCARYGWGLECSGNDSGSRRLTGDDKYIIRDSQSVLEAPIEENAAGIAANREEIKTKASTTYATGIGAIGVAIGATGVVGFLTYLASQAENRSEIKTAKARIDLAKLDGLPILIPAPGELSNKELGNQLNDFFLNHPQHKALFETLERSETERLHTWASWMTPHSLDYAQKAARLELISLIAISGFTKHFSEQETKMYGDQSMADILNTAMKRDPKGANEDDGESTPKWVNKTREAYIREQTTEEVSV
jgi:acylphosphatase